MRLLLVCITIWQVNMQMVQEETCEMVHRIRKKDTHNIHHDLRLKRSFVSEKESNSNSHDDQHQKEDFDERHHHHHHGHHRSSHLLKRFKRAYGGTIVKDLTDFGLEFYVHVQVSVGGMEYQYCGGAFLTTAWVVTAAHCIKNAKNGDIDVNNITILAGKADMADHPDANMFQVETYAFIDPEMHTTCETECHPTVIDLVFLNLKRLARHLETAVPIPLGDDVHERHVCVIGANPGGRNFLRVFSSKTERIHDSQRVDLVSVDAKSDYGICHGDSGSPLVSFDPKKKIFVLEGVAYFLNYVNTEEAKKKTCPSEFISHQAFTLMTTHLKKIYEIIPELSPVRTSPADFSLPFKMSLGAHIEMGNSLEISGKFKDRAESFEINFFSAIPMSSVVTEASRFHLKFRFDKNIMVANQMRNYEWDHSTEVQMKNPFKAGMAFELRMTVFEDVISVRANEVEVLSYEFAKSNFYFDEFANAEYFEVDGDALVNKIHFGGSMYTTPHTTILSGEKGNRRFGYNSYIEFYAIPNGNWNVSLLGDSPQEVLFAANIEFDASGNGKTGMVVISGLTSDGRQSKEYGGPFPFRLDVGATVRIVNSPHHIKILVNKKIAFEFRHKVSGVTQVYKKCVINGNLELLDVFAMLENAPRPPKRRRRELLRRKQERRKKHLLFLQMLQ